MQQSTRSPSPERPGGSAGTSPKSSGRGATTWCRSRRRGRRRHHRRGPRRGTDRRRHDVVDAAAGPSPDQQAATEFFTTSPPQPAARQKSEPACSRLVLVSSSGWTASRPATWPRSSRTSRRTFAGPIPAHILRAAQFHEFVEAFYAWRSQGDVIYVWGCGRSSSPPPGGRGAGRAGHGAGRGGRRAGGRSGSRRARGGAASPTRRVLVARRGLGLRIQECVRPQGPRRGSDAAVARCPARGRRSPARRSRSGSRPPQPSAPEHGTRRAPRAGHYAAPSPSTRRSSRFELPDGGAVAGQLARRAGAKMGVSASKSSRAITPQAGSSAGGRRSGGPPR